MPLNRPYPEDMPQDVPQDVPQQVRDGMIVNPTSPTEEELWAARARSEVMATAAAQQGMPQGMAQGVPQQDVPQQGMAQQDMPQDMAQGGEPQRGKASSGRQQFVKGLLQNFLFSFGRAMAAQAEGKSPMAAGIMAPFELDQLRRQKQRDLLMMRGQEQSQQMGALSTAIQAIRAGPGVEKGLIPMGDPAPLPPSADFVGPLPTQSRIVDPISVGPLPDFIARLVGGPSIDVQPEGGMEYQVEQHRREQEQQFKMQTELEVKRAGLRHKTLEDLALESLGPFPSIDDLLRMREMLNEPNAELRAMHLRTMQARMEITEAQNASLKDLDPAFVTAATSISAAAYRDLGLPIHREVAANAEMILEGWDREDRDFALISGTARLTDPGGAVRQGEADIVQFATSPMIESWKEAIVRVFNNKGGILPKAAREALQIFAIQLVTDRYRTWKNEATQFRTKWMQKGKVPSEAIILINPFSKLLDRKEFSHLTPFGTPLGSPIQWPAEVLDPPGSSAPLSGAGQPTGAAAGGGSLDDAFIGAIDKPPGL
jgi:hypothetical protein